MISNGPIIGLIYSYVVLPRRSKVDWSRNYWQERKDRIRREIQAGTWRFSPKAETEPNG